MAREPAWVPLSLPTGQTRATRPARLAFRAAIAEGAVYVVAILLVMWPGLWHARTQILGAGDDARYYTWLGWRMGRLIAHGHLVPFHVGDVIHPFGLDLRLLDGYLPSYVSGLFNLVVGPVLAFNLTFVTGAILNVLAARSLARRLSPRRLVYTIAAVAFLTAPPIALNVQLGLLPLFWAFTAPLLIADALDVVTGARGVRPVRLAVLLVLAYLCSVYFVVFGGLAYGVIVGIAAVRARDWRIAKLTAAGVLIAVIVLLPFIVPRIQFDHTESARGVDTELLGDSNFFSADALSLVRATDAFDIPGCRVRPFVEKSIVRLPDVRYAIEATIFPGLLLLVGFVVFLTKRDRRRLPLWVTAAVLFTFGLGPSLKVAGNFVWKHGGSPVSWLPYRAAARGAGTRRAARAGTGRVRARGGARGRDGARVAPAGRVVARTEPGSSAPGPACCSRRISWFRSRPRRSPRPRRARARCARSRSSRGRATRCLSVPADCDPAFVSLQVFHQTPVVGCAGSFAANPWSKLRALHRFGRVHEAALRPAPPTADWTRRTTRTGPFSAE